MLGGAWTQVFVGRAVDATRGTYAHPDAQDFLKAYGLQQSKRYGHLDHTSEVAGTRALPLACLIGQADLNDNSCVRYEHFML